MKPDNFVVGFIFDQFFNSVLLVEKKRPAWQKGRLNGIGGKIEEGEEPRAAMIRECLEETGVDLSGEWQHMGFMSGTNNDGRPFICHIFRAVTKKLYHVTQIEDEPLHIMDVHLIDKQFTIDNLKWIIPMLARDHHLKTILVEYNFQG